MVTYIYVNVMNLQKRANAVLDGLGVGVLCVFGWEGFLRYITVLPFFPIHRNRLFSFFFLLRWLGWNDYRFIGWYLWLIIGFAGEAVKDSWGIKRERELETGDRGGQPQWVKIRCLEKRALNATMNKVFIAFLGLMINGWCVVGYFRYINIIFGLNEKRICQNIYLKFLRIEWIFAKTNSHLVGFSVSVKLMELISELSECNIVRTNLRMIWDDPIPSYRVKDSIKLVTLQQFWCP